MPRAARTAKLLAVVAAVLVVAGLGLGWSSARTGTSFGWFASGEPFDGSSWFVVWTPRAALAAAVVVAGLLVGAAAGGFALGRRQARRDY